MKGESQDGRLKCLAFVGFVFGIMLYILLNVLIPALSTS